MLLELPNLEKEQAREILKKMESSLGKKRGDLTSDLEEASDPVLRLALSRYYTFRPPEFDPQDIRFQTYLLAQEKYGGFVPHSNKSEFLAFIHSKNITEELLWQDSEENHTLLKIKEPSVEDLCDSYRYFSLFNSIKKSSKITARFEAELKPQMIRDLFFLSKKFSMLCDFTPHDLEIYPPQELLPRKYGYILMKFLRSIIRFSPKEISFAVGFRKLSILPSDISSILNIPEEDAITFDSSPEENFANLFGPMRQRWRLQRDPYPIIKDDVIFMPDFSLDLSEHVEKRIYLEIVGYWRPEYIRKKKDKLSLLQKYGIPLILLIDEKLKKNFLDVSYPTFFFSSRLPIMALENYLRQIEQSEYLKIKDIWPDILSEFAKSLAGRPYIELKELGKLGFLKEEFLCKKDLMPSYSLLPSGLIQNSVLQSAKSLKLEGPISEAEKKLEKLGLPLNILPSLGYKISWKSLLQGTIIKQ